MTANRMIFLLMPTYEWLYSPFFFIEMEPASRFWSKEHRKSSKNFKKSLKKMKISPPEMTANGNILFKIQIN